LLQIHYILQLKNKK